LQKTVDGRLKLPSGTLDALHPHIMRNFDDISKDLASFVNLWDTMANEDLLGKYRRRNKPLNYYWRAMKSALPLLILIQDTLQNGFWLSSTFGPALEDQFCDIGTM
jgi:hypothetical protein